jgi:ABC-type antimicrobial peptide transport system permease subunit
MRSNHFCATRWARFHRDADDARLAKLLALATVIAMIIAACGAYVLAADAVQRRKQEIALLRLFGARRLDIGRLVAAEVGGIVLLSAALAVTSFAATRHAWVAMELKPAVALRT